MTQEQTEYILRSKLQKVDEITAFPMSKSDSCSRGYETFFHTTESEIIDLISKLQNLREHGIHFTHSCSTQSGDDEHHKK